MSANYVTVGLVTMESKSKKALENPGSLKMMKAMDLTRIAGRAVVTL